MNNINRKPLIAIAVGLLLLVSLYLIFRPKPNNTQPSTAQNSDSQMENNEITNITGNIFDVLKAGNSVKCTYTTGDTNYTSEGTTYVAGSKFRADMKTSMEDNTQIESHMISDGEWAYSWSNAMPQGFKMKISDLNKQVEQTNPEVQRDANLNTALRDFESKIDYKCIKWDVDNSMFNVPTDVQFSDFSQMMNGNPSGACAACNYIQDADAKAQCLSSLNCN
jgi:hypothetical protein